MNVTVKAIHFDASQKLIDFINKKVGKIVAHNDDIMNVEVTLKVVKPETALNKEAAIRLVCPDHDDIFASKTANTFEEAVDLCVDALKKQLEKSKNKN